MTLIWPARAHLLLAPIGLVSLLGFCAPSFANHVHGRQELGVGFMGPRLAL